MSRRLVDVLDLFTLTALEDAAGRYFLGGQPDEPGRVRVYGGQVVAQALAAAAATVSDRRPHSMHVSFLRPGDPTVGLRYDVTVLREGRSLSTRRVSASQDGTLVMEGLFSFVVPLDGHEYQTPMPVVPDPETLPELGDRLREYLPPDDEYLSLVRFPLLDLHYVGEPPRIAVDAAAPDAFPSDAEVCRVWLRLRDDPPAELSTDPLLAACLLGFVSDWTILDPVQTAIGKTWQELDRMASLDHSVWLHRPVDFTDWLLYEQRCPTANGGLGLGTGSIFNRDGTLVCTVTQEGFLGRRV